MSSFISLHKDHGGVGVIEFALLAPIFLLLVFAVIGFGWVYVIYEAEGRAVSSTGRAIQNDASLTADSATLQSEADAVFGAPLAQFGGNTGNSICAQWYFPPNEPLPSSPSAYCSGNTWNLGPPTDPSYTPGTSYLVAIAAQATPQMPIPDIYSWLVHIPLGQYSVVSVGGGCAAPPNCSSGQVLTYSSGTGYSCVTPIVPSLCNSSAILLLAGKEICPPPFVPTPGASPGTFSCGVLCSPPAIASPVAIDGSYTCTAANSPPQSCLATVIQTN